VYELESEIELTARQQQEKSLQSKGVSSKGKLYIMPVTLIIIFGDL